MAEEGNLSRADIAWLKDSVTKSDLDAVQKEKIVRELTEKETGDETTTGSSAWRRKMQDWTLLTLFLTEMQWNSLLDPKVNSLTIIGELTNHLCEMGLRTPSEPAMAMMAALVLYRDPERDVVKASEERLHAYYLTMKGTIQTKKEKYRKVPTPTEFIQSLPASSVDLPQQLSQKYTFVPPRFPFPDVMALARQIRCRTPKGGKVPASGPGPLQGQMTLESVAQGLGLAMGMLQMQNFNATSSCQLQMLSPKNASQASQLQSLLGTAAAAGGSTALSSPAFPPQLALPAPSSQMQASVSVPSASAPVPQVEQEKPAGQSEALPASERLLALEDEKKQEIPASTVPAQVPAPRAGSMSLLDSIQRMQGKPESHEDATLRDANSLEHVGDEKNAKKRPSASSQSVKPSQNIKVPVKKKKNKSSPVKQPVLKRPAARVASASASSAAQSNRPSVVPMVQWQRFNEKKKAVIGKVPVKVLLDFKTGCSSCRNATFCTPSCWFARGF